LTEKSKANPILGFSDTETVKLDFDETSFSSVKYWALRATKWFKLRGFVILKSSEKCYHVVFDRVVSWFMKWFKLKGFVILKSSNKSYHVVFDRKVSWTQNMRVVAWVALQTHNMSLRKWFLMQCIKGCSTLRVSPKREKPPPRIVYRYGKLDQNVKDFLKYREIIKKMSQKCGKMAFFERFCRCF
jgi:hypothetical protein